MQELIQNLTFNTSLDHAPTYNILGGIRSRTSDEQLQTSLRGLNKSVASTISNPSIVQLESGASHGSVGGVSGAPGRDKIDVGDLTTSQADRVRELTQLLQEQSGKGVDFALKTLQTENQDLKKQIQDLRHRLEASDANLNSETAAARDQLARLRQQHDSTSDELFSLQQEKLKLQLSLQQFERNQSHLKEERDQAIEKVKKYEEQVNGYLEQIKQLQNQLSSAENAIQTMVRIMEQHKIIPPPIPATQNNKNLKNSINATSMTGSVVRSTSVGQRKSEDGSLSQTVVHTSPTMIRKCSACNVIDQPSPGSSGENQNSNDRAAKVLHQLRQEKKDTETDLQNLVSEAYVNPEALYKNIHQVSKLINQTKTKKKEIRQLSMYKKQVDRLGVKMK